MTKEQLDNIMYDSGLPYAIEEEKHEWMVTVHRKSISSLTLSFLCSWKDFSGIELVRDPTQQVKDIMVLHFDK